MTEQTRPDEDISVLVVDDEAMIRRSLRRRLRYEGWRVTEAASGPEALASLERETPDLVVLDIKMPGMDGMEVLRRIRERDPSIAVAMHTAHGDIETAVRAIDAGAAHFFEKGGSGDIGARLRVALDKAAVLERKRLAEENRELARELDAHRNREGARRRLVGTSAVMDAVRERIDRVAPTDVRVLITGESGTGKEVVARLIHDASPRAAAPFVEVNCAAIPEELIESELFGAERGSYTGAHRQRIGKFEQANGGTLFLDEVGDMSPRTQAKVLRALEESSINRVGGSRSVEVDVRVLSATNQDLSSGAFRNDLLHRLEVVPIRMPALRERPGDVPLLVAHFTELLTPEGEPLRRFTAAALQRLAGHAFPGNVRELRNLVERLLILAAGEEVSEEDVREHLDLRSGPPARPGERLDAYLARAGKALVEQRLAELGGDRERAAESLGIPVADLDRRVG